MASPMNEASQELVGGENGAEDGEIPAGIDEEMDADAKALEKNVERNLGLGLRDHCINKHTKGNMACNCLSVLRGCEDYCQAVAEYQIMFAKLDFVEKKKIVIEWMRSNPNEGAKKRYRIPYILDPSDDAMKYQELKKCLVCQSAMMDILGTGYKWWRGCLKHYNQMTIPSHKLTGKMSNKKRKFLQDFEDDLKSHFEELEKEAEPIATRYVREVTGETTLRDADDSMLYLPSFFTQRNCYAKFCLEKRGTKISTTNKGTVVKTPAVAGTVNSTPSWSAYCTYWKENHPKLKVRKPTEDICSYCYKFYNSHKFRKTNSAPNSGEDGGGTHDNDEVFFDTNEEESSMPEAEPTDNPTAGVTNGVTVATDTEAMEKAILAAALHVKMARSMRQFVNEKIAAAREDRRNNVQQDIHCYS
jgi:hypothetical protein